MVDHLAENDEHALTIVRDIVSHLGANTGAAKDVALKDPRPPKYDAEDLYALIPEDVRAPYDVKEVIARLVDAGKLDYAQRVADVWPEFAQAGKAAITIEQVMSHQEGLSGFPDEMEPSLWFDWDAVCAKLAAMAPLWPPGTASGYHPITFGYLAGEIFRRVDGRTMGTALREDLARPFGLDLWIGLPDAEHGRVADLQRPNGLPNFGEIKAATKAAFLTPWSSPAGRGQAEWRRIEIPSANGHATAPALARLIDSPCTAGAASRALSSGVRTL